jgi:hypothetical protein
MIWSKEEEKEFELEVLATLNGKKFIDLPFYRYLYSPEEELNCIREFENFGKRLKNKGYYTETIYMSEILVQALKNLGFLEESLFKIEESSFSEIEENLEEVLTEEVVDILSIHLKNKNSSYCVIILRIGSIFPFVHVSSLLSKLEGYVKCTLIIPYPGNKEGEMLDYEGDNIRNYYRGKCF